MKPKENTEDRNILCFLFGHKYRCFMAFSSMCSRCGDVYSYNWESCGICGSRLYLKKKGNKKFLTCMKGHLGGKNWEMTEQEYAELKRQDILSEGFIRHPKKFVNACYN